MKKIMNKNQIIKQCNYPVEVVESIRETISIINENYGAERNVDEDLGGYLLIAENIVDIEMLRNDKLEGLEAEYTDIIECKGGVNYTSSLFLLSSDFAIVVVTTEEFSTFLIH